VRQADDMLRRGDGGVSATPAEQEPRLLDQLLYSRVTAPAFAGVLYGTPNRLWGVRRTGLDLVTPLNETIP